MQLTATAACVSAGALAPRRQQHRRHTPLVTRASTQEGTPNKGQSGIHDPVGWGKRGGAYKPMEAGLEEQRHMQAAALDAEQHKPGARPGSAGLDRYDAANKEIRAVEQERAVGRDMTASDDEWENMPKTKKWYMEVKALLYSWLNTGVEPL